MKITQQQIRNIIREELEAILREDTYGSEVVNRYKRSMIKGKAKLIGEEDNPCWDGYEMVGMKEKDGKEVPNCVPMQNEAEQIDKDSMPCNDPKGTPSHPKKSHVVKACDDGKEKIIRFGEQGAETAGEPKKGESERMKNKRKSFKARHGKNIKKGKMSAAYWANKEKW